MAKKAGITVTAKACRTFAGGEAGLYDAKYKAVTEYGGRETRLECEFPCRAVGSVLVGQKGKFVLIGDQK